MEETKPADEKTERPSGTPLIHRVCEACNNMFTTHPGSKELRCPNCRKE